jgi:hypothetical protein
VYPLHLDHWHRLLVEHIVVPVLLKESPKMLVGAPLLLMEGDDVPWIHSVVVDHFPNGVRYRGPYLHTLILVGCRRSSTTRRGVLGRGLLMEHARSSMLGKSLGLSRGTLARTSGTGRLTVLGVPFMSFTSYDLQKRSKQRK